MTATKSLGIWLDHASAHLMEFSEEHGESTVIESESTHEEKAASLGHSEHVMHNKEQHQQSAFYKKLSEAIKGYDDVLLFGPTDAKLELHNLLKADHHFDKIKIEVKQAGKMTEHEQHGFVKEHFKRN